MTKPININSARRCPVCGEKELRAIEVCSESCGQRKTSWSCTCGDAIVYIVENSEEFAGGKD